MAISKDVCQQITDSIIRELESGTLPWCKPWRGGDTMRVPVLPRRHTGQAYRGINILILWAKADAAGYRNAHWMTFQQALDYKACVRKGEKGTQIVFANKILKDETNSAGETSTKVIPFLKAYTVFNAEQIDGLPARFATPSAPLAVTNNPGLDWFAYADAQTWFDAIPATLSHGGDRAYYQPSTDSVRMPERDAFTSERAYFSVLAHELTHWTGAESRLNRSMGKRFGDDAYAMEELVAELGAAFTLAELGIMPAIREDHAPYIASWIKVLKDDSRAIVTAAAKASDAVAHLQSYHAADTIMELDDAA